MAYQMTFTLSDQEYAALIAKAEQTGKPLDLLLHEAIAPLVELPPKEPNPMDEQNFLKYLQHNGIIFQQTTYVERTNCVPMTPCSWHALLPSKMSPWPSRSILQCLFVRMRNY